MDAIRKNILTALLPFATWIGLQTILPATAGAYAVRTAATAAVGLVCLAFHNKAIKASNALKALKALNTPKALIGLAAGLVVCALWIWPDSFPWYRTWLCWPIGSPPAPPAASPYDPAVCGWTLTIVKLVGSAFVIAPVEEVFFRSFLYRWLQNRDFAAVPLSRFDLSAFLWMVFLFTLEHDRPVAAAMAGGVYGLLAIRWGLGSAIVAHVVTNLALGLHVIYHGAWAFW